MTSTSPFLTVFRIKIWPVLEKVRLSRFKIPLKSNFALTIHCTIYIYVFILHKNIFHDKLKYG